VPVTVSVPLVDWTTPVLSSVGVVIVKLLLACNVPLTATAPLVPIAVTPVVPVIDWLPLKDTKLLLAVRDTPPDEADMLPVPFTASPLLPVNWIAPWFAVIVPELLTLTGGLPIVPTPALTVPVMAANVRLEPVPALRD